jgi:hypothetical protein
MEALGPRGCSPKEDTLRTLNTAALIAILAGPAAAEGWVFSQSQGEDSVCVLTAPGETWSTTNNLSISNSRPVPKALTIEYAGGNGAATATFKNARNATMVVAGEHNHRVLPGSTVGDDFWVEIPTPAAFGRFLFSSVFAFSTETGRYGVALDESDHREIKRWTACVKNIGG